MAFADSPTFFVSTTTKTLCTTVLSVRGLLACAIFIAISNVLFAKIKMFQRKLKLISGFPGLRYYPLVGSLPELTELVWSPCRDILPWSKNKTAKYGPVFKIWNYGQPKLFVSCLETALALQQNGNIQAKPTDAIKVSKVANGEGLIVLEPEIHGIRRKQWMQWMRRKTIDRHEITFRNGALRLCEELEQFELTGQEFDIVSLAKHATLRNILGAAYGIKVTSNITESETREFVRIHNIFALNMMQKQFQPWYANDWIYFNLTPVGRQMRRLAVYGNNMTAKALKEKVLDKNINKEDDTDKPASFVDHLLDLKENGLLSDHELFQELNIFITGGYETVALSVCYTLYLLSLNLEHQTRVAEEITEIFGGNLTDFENVTTAHLRKMKYLELCIKESLRLYPAAPFSLRRTCQEIVMADGKVIPENVDIFVEIHQIHRNPKYFPEPEKFIPSRHLTPNAAYMPFALGASNCVGQVLAMQEMKMILAILLMKFKWSTTETKDPTLMWSTFLFPVDGLHCKIEKRFEI